MAELLFSLPREADDNVGGQGDAGYRAANVVDPLTIVADGVGSTHTPQHIVVTGLNRQVDVLAELRQPAHCIDYPVRHVFRMGCQEADALDSIDIVHRLQQIGQVRMARKVVAVGVDRLTQERDFFDPSTSEALDLGDDIRQWTADLTATSVRHDAVRADEVTTIDDRNEGGNLGVARALGVVVRQVGEIHVDLSQLGRDFYQPVELGWLVEEVDVREAFGELLLLTGHHTTCQGDAGLGSLPLHACQSSDFAGDLVLGGLANDAGVDDDDVGLVFDLRRNIACLAQHGGGFGGLRFVHLATNGPDEIAFHAVERRFTRLAAAADLDG